MTWLEFMENTLIIVSNLFWTRFRQIMKKDNSKERVGGTWLLICGWLPKGLILEPFGWGIPNVLISLSAYINTKMNGVLSI